MAILYEHQFEQVKMVLQMKLEEFHAQNYKELTLEDLWNYCINKKWKKRNFEEVRIHEIVATIFSLSPSEIINHAHINELYNTDLKIGLDKEELDMLLKPLKSENSL